MSTLSPGIPETNNPDWGFFGTMSGYVCPHGAWALAFPAIRQATGATADGVLGFLDSRHGRHFADDVVMALQEGRTLPEAISVAIARWMGWKTTRFHTEDYGIPRGLPVLTGMTTFFEIEADMMA